MHSIRWLSDEEGIFFSIYNVDFSSCRLFGLSKIMMDEFLIN